MISKRVRHSIGYILFCLLLTSCAFNRQCLYRENVTAYARSLLELDRHYITIQVQVGKMEAWGPQIEKRGGYIVLRGYNLYRLFEANYTEYNFGNYLLALGIRHEDLLLTAAQFEQVKEYLISDEDAKKYLAIRPSAMIRKYGKQGFLPGINEDNPGYEERCALFNLLKNGYALYVEDESGFLTYRKYGAGTDPF